MVLMGKVRKLKDGGEAMKTTKTKALSMNTSISRILTKSRKNSSSAWLASFSNSTMRSIILTANHQPLFLSWLFPAWAQKVSCPRPHSAVRHPCPCQRIINRCSILMPYCLIFMARSEMSVHTSTSSVSQEAPWTWPASHNVIMLLKNWGNSHVSKLFLATASST